MPRQARYRLVGVPQYVACRGHNGAPVFEGPADYRKFRDCLEESAVEVGCAIHAYTLVRNEVRVLITPRSSDGVSRFMQSTGRSYGQYFNALHGRRGTLWDGRYRAALIEPGHATRTAYACIDTMPIRLGLDTGSRSYRWTSYRFNARGERDAILTPHASYITLGATPAERRQRYAYLLGRGWPEAEIAELEGTLNRGLVFGAEAFKDDVEHSLRLRVRSGVPGRPRSRIPLPLTSEGAMRP